MRWLRYSGWTICVLVVLLVAATAVAGFIAWQSKTIGELDAKRSAPDMTAAACLKSKEKCNLAENAPIGALARYRRCGEVIAGTRIQGEPLGCSEQGITDLWLRDWTNPGQTTYRQLRRGCRKHDFCYRHGKATYGLLRPQCDEEFLSESLRECWLIYGNENESEIFRDRDVLRWSCQVRASVAYLGVKLAASKYFQTTESSLCEYEGGPHAARDQVVAGRFLGGDRDYVISLSLAPNQNALTIRLLSFGIDGQSQEEAVENVSPANVAIGDRDWACQRRRTADGGFATDCPEWLGQTMLENTADWLRFAPVVVDADGDGSDELVIPSLVPDFGLVFTHIRVKKNETGVIGFEPVRAFLGVARLAKADAANGGCETGLEFADCGSATQPTLPQLLSSEAATQHSGFQFDVVASVDAGCAPERQPNKQDLLLFSTFSDFPKNPTDEVKEKRKGWDSDYVLRRFIFDAQAQRWEMRRDRFNNDFHRMAGCNVRLGRDQFQTHARLQYPSFPVRMPPAKDKSGATVLTCTHDERLAVISRDKCATTSPVSKAGSLSDIDVMLYKIKPGYKLVSDEEKEKAYGKSDKDELRMAEIRWLPVLWPETADPILTSRAAHEHGIAAVATFIGGTDKIGALDKQLHVGKLLDDKRLREGHLPVIAVLRSEQLRALREEGQDRYADTMGHAPDLYGVFKSSDFAKTISEKRSNLWDPHRYGSVKLYFKMPSVLAPFTAAGAKGVSVVFFANSALWNETNDPADWHPSERLPIPDGWFRVMIVPIPGTSTTPSGQPRMIDCPADAIAEGSAKPAAQIGSPHFLRHEPVLAGKFFDSDAGGSLAVAWRDAGGGVKLTALRYEGQEKTWKFGKRTCDRPAKMEGSELYRDRLN